MTVGRGKKAVVVGAGIGGLTAAAALRRIGMDVEVHERARELRPAGGAISLMTNAVLALRTLDIDLRFEEHAEILEELHFLTKRGKPIRTLRFKEICARLGAPSFGITRTLLQQLLLKEIDDCPVRLGAAATGFEPDGTGVRVRFEDGSETYGDVLIGADGFNSAIRRGLTGPEQPRETGYLCWVATPRFEHPRITKQYGAHYWGRGKRFGIANIGGGEIYWWGTKNMPAARARDWRAQGGRKAEIVRAYAGWADEVVAAVEATPFEEITAFPARDRPFLERWGKGPVTLLGDAAHPMMTSLGQGACMAIEDAVVLAHHLRGADDPARALRAYEAERRPRTKKIVEGAHALSALEQTENPLRILGRDLFFRFAPDSAVDKQNAEYLEFPAPAAASPDSCPTKEQP
ncbi:FAD-dependent monooxygenase [Streptomyces luteolus]|uniref:FAD-dependent monooxygenase n=1 Tax=Streptomyces luteolus TaxID=3043615 RepID=A0ABT6T452_9ACTN|nr:FAD-dependent monooxygenase [Streptomyces sp. B-S-A12]MDI3422644.1 FAD-dependent monooxygenase [Streptomyces sp. B-S-A12]